YQLGDIEIVTAQLSAIARRLEATAIVVSGSVLRFVPDATAAMMERDGLRIVPAENLLTSTAGNEDFDPDAAPGPALIQLTSGSTGRPRGVVISQERLMMHMASMSEALPMRREGVRGVSWLPLHHDMGLIGGLLFPLYNGFPIHLLSPLDFRSNPFS